MPESSLILHQFVSSHFNEKARWALDYKGLPHRRLDYLPGPHAPRIRKLSGGPTSTPLMEHGAGTVSGSAAIIDWLETHYPDPALYPAESAPRAQALEIQAHYDAVVGPAARTFVFSFLIRYPDYLCKTFSHSKAWPKRVLYRAMLPAAMPLIARANKVVDPADIDAAGRVIGSTLDELASMINDSDLLVGSNFSVADLTAASLLAPLAQITHIDMARQQPVPADLRDYLESLQAHPAIHWVQRQYSKHRPDPRAT